VRRFGRDDESLRDVPLVGGAVPTSRSVLPEGGKIQKIAESSPANVGYVPPLIGSLRNADRQIVTDPTSSAMQLVPDKI